MLIEPDSGQRRPTLEQIRAAGRASSHELMGDPGFSCPTSETWVRLHAQSTPLDPTVLEKEAARFLGLENRQHPITATSPDPLGEYFQGAFGGLQDASHPAIVRQALYGTTYGTHHSRQVILAELQATAEANVIRRNNGIPSQNDINRGSAWYYLGRALAMDFAAGRRKAIPTNLPLMPDYLR
jgi:hypothetical protein